MTGSFDTIESDFISAKDSFNIIKFAYRERCSKLFFHEATASINDSILNSSQIEDSSKLLDFTKKELKAVKKFYKEENEELKELSKKIYNLENSEQNLDLENKEKSLNEELAKVELWYNNIKDDVDLVSEYNKVNFEIEKLEKKIYECKAYINCDLISKRMFEENSLRKQYEALQSRFGRLTMINTENDIEDIFNWYTNLVLIFKKIFGECTASISGDKCTIQIVSSEKTVKLILENYKIVYIFCDNEDDIKYCMFLDDPSLMISKMNL